MSAELYSLAGIATVAVIASAIGLRLIRDESSLKRKRLLAERY